MQKRRKCCKYPYFLDQRCTKHCKYQCFWKPAKKHCKLQHFSRVDRKKCWYLQCFCTFKKTWKARNTVNSGVLATFGRRNAGIYAVFCPWRRQTLVNYSIFCTFWTDFFALMNATTATAGTTTTTTTTTPKTNWYNHNSLVATSWDFVCRSLAYLPPSRLCNTGVNSSNTRSVWSPLDALMALTCLTAAFCWRPRWCGAVSALWTFLVSTFTRWGRRQQGLFPSPNPCRHRRCAKLYNNLYIYLFTCLLIYLFVYLFHFLTAILPYSFFL